MLFLNQTSHIISHRRAKENDIRAMCYKHFTHYLLVCVEWWEQAFRSWDPDCDFQVALLNKTVMAIYEIGIGHVDCSSDWWDHPDIMDVDYQIMPTEWVSQKNKVDREERIKWIFDFFLRNRCSSRLFLERSDLITLSSFPNCDPLNSICVERWCIYPQRDLTICSRDVIYCFSFSTVSFYR
jgi:hypothetical protein